MQVAPFSFVFKFLNFFFLVFGGAREEQGAEVKFDLRSSNNMD